MQSTLVSRDSKGKIRMVSLRSEVVDGIGHIYRCSGLWSGKKTEQPTIDIYNGKVKRDVEAQTQLQFMSLRKKQLDKGYIELSEGKVYADYEIEALVGNNKTNQQGIIKPMLAKQYQDIKNPNLFNKEYYASRKINGVRSILYWDKQEGRIKTQSRGSINYDIPISHIINHPELVNLMKSNPELILDGEIYKFGMNLNRISGICRKQVMNKQSESLEFYLYDVALLNIPFSERLDIINQIQKTLNLDFSPNKEWDDSDLKIQIVPQIPISGWDNIKNLHDQWVQEGWEGLVIREINGLYHSGTRGSYMIKVKSYFDAEYPIIGIAEGLRDEDMCFICQTPSGKLFRAKPIGTRALKHQYIKNIDRLRGKMATIKYFEMSGAGTDIPQQPVLIGIRDYE